MTKKAMNTISIKSASIFHPVFAVASALFLGALSTGCVADPDQSEIDDEDTIGETQDPLTGWTAWSWGTTTDLVGISISSSTQMTCVLSGVAGNLNAGQVFGGSANEPSVAEVRWGSSNYTLLAHGGAYADYSNDPVFANNPVAARSTCFFATSGDGGTWQSQSKNYPPSWPVWITGLGESNRQCFLSGITGVVGAWTGTEGGTPYARVVKVTSADSTHPSAGWYVESNLHDEEPHGSHAEVRGTCVDFPSGTIFSSGMVYATEGGTTSVPIGLGMGSGIKGCALTGVTGALTVNNFTDGALITAPATLDGTWSITVKNGKQANWACAK
jgi:hypothetical protein